MSTTIGASLHPITHTPCTALAGHHTLTGSEDIQISHALTMATVQASKALKRAHLMQDSADMLDQADQRDEENNISRMLISKIAQQGE